MASSSSSSSTTTAATACGGAVALLDLPLQSAVGLDGHIIVLQRNDFVGIQKLPSDNSLHLLTVRPAVSKSSTSMDHHQQQQQQQQQQTGISDLNFLTCGFILFPPPSPSKMTATSEADFWIVARRFDPTTEEVGALPLDALTTQNLIKQVQRGQMKQRVVPYGSILSSAQMASWKTQTNFISRRLLHKRGCLEHGDKVVPGCFQEDDVSNTSSSKPVDGKSLVYPPIPVLDETRKVKRTSHVGTRRYLAQLSPADRTALFSKNHHSPADQAFSDVLARYYGDCWKQLVGDVQLSYLMFLHIQCLTSLEHWRDLVAMLSMVDSIHISQHVELYAHLLGVLTVQVSSMEQDFFEDVEFSGDNFFLPAVISLCSQCSRVDDNRVADALAAFTKTLSTRFPTSFSDNDSGQWLGHGNTTGQANTTDFNQELMPTRMNETATDVSMRDDTNDSEEDSDDNPVVVPISEVESSIARSCARARAIPSSVPTEYSEQERESYRLLFAAKMEHEDILMVCARILDEANDVSLVREAAAYLEEVEAKRAHD